MMCFGQMRKSLEVFVEEGAVEEVFIDLFSRVLLKFVELQLEFKALLPSVFFPSPAVLFVRGLFTRFPTFTSFFHTLAAVLVVRLV